MANIRLTCPKCESELELDAAFDGQEVECGSCGHVFVARTRSGAADRASESDPSAKPASSPRTTPRGPDERGDEPEERPPEPRSERRPPRPAPPSRRPGPRSRRPVRRSRRDEYDYEPPDSDESDYYYRDPARGPRSGNSLAVASLVLGLVSVGVVLLTLPFACCCAVLPLPLTVPLSLAAVVTGGLGVRGDDDRKPLAVVGLVLGVMCLGFTVLQLAFGIIPQMNPGR